MPAKEIDRKRRVCHQVKSEVTNHENTYMIIGFSRKGLDYENIFLRSLDLIGKEPKIFTPSLDN